MRRKEEHGLSLVEVLVATLLFVVLMAIALDLLPDILRSRNLDNLSYQVNRECQRVLAQLSKDISAAGFRFASPTAFGEDLAAIRTPAENHLRMQCITDIGQLATAADPGSYTSVSPLRLTLSGFGRLAGIRALICTYAGETTYLDVQEIFPESNQVDVMGAIEDTIPAGTPLAAVQVIEYWMDGTDLVREINDDAGSQETVAVDPAGTSITYTMNDGGIRTQLTGTDLANLLYVNISLQMTRTAPAPGGRTIRISSSASQRVKPLNLDSFGGDEEV